MLRPALGLTVALAVGCAPVTVVPGPAGPKAAAPSSGPVITLPQARQVWDHYVAASGPQTTKTGNPALALSLETGPRRRFDSVWDAAALKKPNLTGAALRRALTRLAPPAYTAPAFYLPDTAGYPRFFVVDVTEKRTSGHSAGSGAPVSRDGAGIYPFGPTLMLFEQARTGARWLLASSASLAVGETLPKLATDSAGYVPAVAPTAATLLAPPDDVGPLQAAVVDGGPASTATRAVAAGPLTTGLYEGAVNGADELTAPHGDVYQWELEGARFPEFALRTAAGGALVFYAMKLSTTVAVPGFINKADPVLSGPPIQVPGDVRPLLPSGQLAPLVELSAGQLLSFAAVDPAPGRARIQVIAMGGGLTSATAS
jgi:hypothetical protein